MGQSYYKLSVMCISPSPFHLALHLASTGKEGEKSKNVRCKCATVAPYHLCARLGSHPRPGREGKTKTICGADVAHLHHIFSAGKPTGQPGLRKSRSLRS